MKTTSLFQLLALPATLAFVQLEIVATEGVEGMKVAAKGDIPKIQITGADTYEKDGLRCLDDNHKWTSECQNRPKHRKSGESYFTDVPKDPQPFTIAIQEQQDQKDDGMRSVSYQSCRIAYTDTTV